MVGAKELMISILFVVAVMALMILPRGDKPSLFKQFRDQYKAEQLKKQPAPTAPHAEPESATQ